MNTAVVRTTVSPEISAKDRLVFLVFLSLALHAVIILGVVFTATELLENKEPPQLEILLVQSKSDKAPEDADFLANANKEGGGDSDQKLAPSSPFVTPFTGNEAQIAMQSGALENKQVQNNNQTETITTRQAPDVSLIKPVQEEQKDQIKSNKPSEVNQIEAEIASLEAAFKLEFQKYAQRPRRTYITARTREHKFASYMKAWEAKVERIGNEKYPEEALKQKIAGTLVLDIALNYDGSIHSYNLRRSSGKQILDDAAARIVKLASPYAPFSREIRKETDILHIIRTWVFSSDGKLYTK